MDPATITDRVEQVLESEQHIRLAYLYGSVARGEDHSDSDIGSHIIAADELAHPDDYQDIFTVLAQEDIIGTELGTRLGDMAGFRNLLVHRYTEIDLERLYTILTDHTDDIETFTDQILQQLDT